MKAKVRVSEGSAVTIVVRGQQIAAPAEQGRLVLA